MGIVSPVGSAVETAWPCILAGRSGIGPITTFDASHFPVRIGGAVKDFQIEQYLPVKEARKMDAFIHYGIGARTGHSGFGTGNHRGQRRADRECHRLGIGGLPGIEEGHSAFLKGGPRKLTRSSCRAASSIWSQAISRSCTGSRDRIWRRDRLHHRYPQHRRGGTTDCPRRRRCDGRRRRGSDDHPIGSAASRDAGVVDAQRGTGKGQSPLGQGPGRFRDQRGRRRGGAGGARTCQAARRADLRGADGLRHQR